MGGSLARGSQALTAGVAWGETLDSSSFQRAAGRNERLTRHQRPRKGAGNETALTTCKPPAECRRMFRCRARMQLAPRALESATREQRR